MKKISLVFLLFFYTLAIKVIAQDDFNIKAGNDIKVGVSAELGYIDNFLYDNINELQTAYWLIKPNFYLQTQVKQHLVRFNGDFEHAKYQDFSTNDHSNYNLKPAYYYKFSNNQSVVLKAPLSKAYETMGTGLSLGDSDSLVKGDTKKEEKLSIGYLYGRQDSVARIATTLEYNDNYYTTRRDVTRRQDRNNYYINTSFDYLISDKSYFAVDVKYDQIEFQYNPVLDKNKYAGLVGAKWHYSDITQLSVLLGYEKISFKDANLPDDDAFKWRVLLDWEPVISTKIKFISERNFQEANRLSNGYRIVDTYNLAISKKMTDSFIVDAAIGLNNEDIVSEEAVEQQNYFLAEIKFIYQQSNRIAFFLKVNYNELDASESVLNFQRNGISLGFNAII